MATPPYETILSSDVFKLLVGPEKREFLAHSAVLATQSPSLNKLINGGFKEAKERCADWQHVEVQTFLRFMEFSYTGNYAGAESRRRRRRDSLTSIETTGTDDEATVVPVHTRSWSPIDIDESLWTRFTKLHPNPATEPSIRTSMSNHDHTDTFLSHAKLYTFADCHGIAGLQSLSLRKLHRALLQFQLSIEGIEDVVLLVRYCYENTMDGKDNADELRRLVNIYTACRVEDLWEGQSFRTLVGTNGEFSKGLVGAMLWRLKPE